MEAVAMESFIINKDRRRRKPSNGHVVARLLEAPLPTPRRSSADAPPDPRRASAADASPPQRRNVPFAWESTPGVAKSSAAKDRGVTPPKPPPGRSCGGAGAPRRASCHETTAADGSSEGDTFSDAMDRASSSDRLALAALSARLSSVDGAGSRRAPSFIMARFLPAANAVADKHPRRSPSPRRHRSVRRSNDDDDEAAAARARARQVMMNAPRVCALAREQPKHQHSPSPPPRQNSKDAAAELSPRVDEEASAERACGLMFFFPWRSKPVLLRFPRTSSRSRASNASVAASVTAPSPSPPRRSVTLGDILDKDRRLRDGGDLSRRWCEEENNGGSGKEWSGLGWGAGLLSTSKRYCADAARKALSRLARSATDGGGLRVCRERKSGKWQVASEVGSTPDMMPPLSPPSESWLSHARRSNASRGIDVSQIELM
ncbi:hypothetical protein QOZ80_5AG0369810 [Eleusine coracana subsp. coracana]|nr:hypothetical protein QOZ80_5AG0369810 [Eleusine coracana subsp. coracana]